MSYLSVREVLLSSPMLPMTCPGCNEPVEEISLDASVDLICHTNLEGRVVTDIMVLDDDLEYSYLKEITCGDCGHILLSAMIEPAEQPTAERMLLKLAGEIEEYWHDGADWDVIHALIKEARDRFAPGDYDE